jgi:hypothetical protein
MTFALTSTAVASNQAMPVRYTCDGENLSPPLSWAGVPEGTRAFALVMDDPDAPSGTFTHWLLADIPAADTRLAEGLRSDQVGIAGTNDFGRVGYGGPCPPRGHGPHHYRFHLHALRRPLGLRRGFARADIDAALSDEVISTATLVTLYERKRR